MYCPKCKVEYRDGFTECSDCKCLLVNELPKEISEANLTPNKDIKLVHFSSLKASSLCGLIIWGILSLIFVLVSILFNLPFVKVSMGHLLLIGVLTGFFGNDSAISRLVTLVLGFVIFDGFIGLLFGAINYFFYKYIKSIKVYYILFFIAFCLYWLTYSTF